MELSQTPVKREASPRRNQLGGQYVSGRPLSRDTRVRIIDLSKQGFRQSDISRFTKVTHGCVSKLLAKYQETGMIESAHNVGRPRVITEEIERKIKEYWSSDPGIFCWEIRERLLTESVCQQRDLPSLSSISRVLKEKMIKSTVAGPRRPLLAEDSYPTAPYTRFTIANILGLRSHAVEISKAEEKSPESKDTPFGTPPRMCRSSQRRERTRFTPTQIYELEREFQRNPYPPTLRRREISEKLHVDASKIQVWFANRRARGKKSLMRQPGAHSPYKAFVFWQDPTYFTPRPRFSVPRPHFLPILTHPPMYGSV